MDEKEIIEEKTNPFKDANIISRLTFWWLHELLLKGFKKSLQPGDLYEPLKDDKANFTYRKLQNAWDLQLKKKAQGKDPILKYAILHIVWKKILFYGFLFFFKFFVLAGVNVYCMGVIINSIENGNAMDITTILYMIVLAVSFGASFLLIHTVGFKSERVAMRMRVSVCSVVYRKALRLSKSVITSASAGKLFNILAGDVAKFDQLNMYPMGIWVDPIGSVAILAYLYPKYGVAVLPGIGVLYLTVVLQIFQSRMFSTLRQKKALATDERLKIINGVLSDVKAVKMYSWEIPFLKLINRVRRKELRIIAATTALRAFNMVVYLSGSKFPLYLTILMAVYLGQGIRAEMVFITYALYNLLKLQLTFSFSNAVQKVAETLVSIQRIQDILMMEEIQKHESLTNPNPNHGEMSNILVKNLTASWSKEESSFHLSEISFTVSSGSLCFVTGTVGSGKSSLLLALLGEMMLRHGSAHVTGRIAYVAQEPWLFPESIRKNILFSLPFDEKRYQQVLEACALTEDLDHFPDGDSSYVGDKGVTLSGGQKARIHLARAIYHNSEVYLLDDCLSAVDARVGNHIFRNCINGLIGTSLRILVTHQLQYISPDSFVIVMHKGQIIKQGNYEEIAEKSQDSGHTLDILSQSTFSMDLMELEDVPVKSSTQTGSDSIDIAKSAKFAEEGSTEDSGIHAYLTYFNSFHSIIPVIIFIVVNFAAQLIGISYELWLLTWTLAECDYMFATADFPSNGLYPNDTFIPKTYLRIFHYDVLSSYDAFIIFTYITIAVLIIIIIRTALFFTFTFGASMLIHKRLIKAVLQSKIQFFNENPLGRIMNRFSKDMEAIDDVLPGALNEEIMEMSNLLEVVAIAIYIDYWLGIPTLLLTGLFILVAIYYFRTAIFLKRVEAIRRSPIFTLLNNSIQGQVTIRAHNAENALAKEFESYLDSHSMTWILTLAVTRWLAVYMEFILLLFVISILITLAVSSGSLTGSDIGLLITSATRLNTCMQWGVKQAAEAENQITSIERVKQYIKLPAEDGYDTRIPDSLPKDWPKYGEINFNNVFLHYSIQSPPVLKELSFVVKSGEKIGVVGRTGAGKSSLISALFRLGEVKGDIQIDGVSTAAIPLHILRNAFSIIPQDPVLFVGSIRFNLDPLCQHSDEVLWQALEECQVKDTVQKMDNGLDAIISEGGSNFSVGQRQLLCLSRAILRRSTIILLDEATSNCDKTCDEIIQNVLARRFKKSTILIIAHRLDTIIDCDKVMVMDDGRLIEFGEPFELLQKEDSSFKNLVNQTGKLASSKLMSIAQVHHVYNSDKSSLN